MPTGIILSSGSAGTEEQNKANIEKVLSDNGYEPDKPEAAAPETPVEPKREDFETDEEFEEAQEQFAAEAEERAEKEEEEREAEAQRKQEGRHKLSRRQRAVDKATKELRDELRKANERIQALEGKKPAAETPKVEEPKAPKREDFKTDGEYEDALFDHRYKLRRAKEQVEAAQAALNAQLKENFENYQTQVAAFKEEHDDWDEVVNQSLAIHESVYFAITEQENGAQVTYYLGKHPDFTRRLAEMTPLSAVIEVGRLADRLKSGRPEPARERSSGEKPKPKPRIPEPVKPVATAATSSTLTSREAAAKGNFKAFKAAQRRGA